MAQVGESPEPATPAEPASASPGDAAEGGAASLDDMAALIAESGTDEGAEGEAAPEGEKPAEKPEEKPEEEAAEAKADDKGDEEKKPDFIRKQFAALARDRKKLQAREAAAEAKVQAAAAYEQKAQAFDNVVKRLHEDPIGLLREAGGDALIDKALDGVIASEKSPAEREVEKLRREVEERDKRAAQAQQDQLVANWRAGIVRDVQAKAEQYDLVTSLGMEEAVIEAITQYHIKHNGAVLSVDQAAAGVEKALEAQLAKSKKFAARGGAKPPVTPVTPSRKTGATTLSSVASGDAPPVAADLPMDDDARFEAVLKEMRAAGQLS